MTRASEEAAPPRPLPKTTSSRRGKSLCALNMTTVRTREEAEEAERLAGEKVVRSVETMSGPTERGVRPWKRRDRAAYGGVESLGVGVDASAVRRARGVVHPPAPAPAHARRAGGCALTRTAPPRPSPNRSLGPSSLTIPPSSPSLPPPPPPPLPPTDAAGRFFLPRRRAAVSHAAACEAERGQGVPTAGRAARGRTVAAGRVACSRRGGRDETPSGSTTN